MTTLVLRSSGLRTLVHCVWPLPAATPKSPTALAGIAAFASFANAHEAGVARIVDLFANTQYGGQRQAQRFLGALHHPLYCHAATSDVHDLGDAGNQRPAKLAGHAGKDRTAVVVDALLTGEHQFDAALSIDHASHAPPSRRDRRRRNQWYRPAPPRSHPSPAHV